MINSFRNSRRYLYVIALIVGSIVVVLISTVCYSLYRANLVYNERLVDLNSLDDTSIQTYTHIHVSPDLICGPYEISSNKQRQSYLLFLIGDNNTIYVIPLINVDISRYNEIDKYRNSYKDWICSGNEGNYVNDLVIDGYLVNYDISEDMQGSLIENKAKETFVFYPYAIVAGNNLPDKKNIIGFFIGTLLLLFVLVFICFRGMANYDSNKER